MPTPSEALKPLARSQPRNTLEDLLETQPYVT
jgi:hypothetical protein